MNLLPNLGASHSKFTRSLVGIAEVNEPGRGEISASRLPARGSMSCQDHGGASGAKAKARSL